MNEALDELEKFFPDIIDEMPEEFDSHFFILTLAHRHQQLYMQALNYYADSEQPFQALHGQIARRLGHHLNLVAPQGKTTSTNIFGERSRAEEWHKSGDAP